MRGKSKSKNRGLYLGPVSSLNSTPTLAHTHAHAHTLARAHVLRGIHAHVRAPAHAHAHADALALALTLALSFALSASLALSLSLSLLFPSVVVTALWRGGGRTHGAAFSCRASHGPPIHGEDPCFFFPPRKGRQLLLPAGGEGAVRPRTPP